MLKSLLVLLALGISTALSPVPQAREIIVEGYDSLRYSKQEITAKPGEKLTLVMKTISDQPKSQMAHNWVLLKKGTNARKFVASGQDHESNEYIDPEMEDQVIAKTAMVGGGNKDAVTFTAPSEPGKYTYLCTFPNHYFGGMKGVLIVK